MPQIVNGRFFPLKDIGAAFSANSTGTSRYFTFNTESMLQVFERFIIQEREIAANEIGLYSSVPVGRNRKARFANLTTPAHIFSNRKNGCVWTPKGAIRSNLVEFDLCPIEYNGQQCPDSIWNSCWEQLLGVGNEVHDLLSTPEMQNLIAMFLRQVFYGMGNSFSELVHFANHPLITQVNANGTYAVGVDEWNDYHDQQMSGDCGGWLTLIDELRGLGQKGYDIDIPDTDIAADGSYTGDIVGLMEQLRNSAHPDFRVWIQDGYRSPSGVVLWPVVLLTSALFDAYEEYIRTTYQATESGFQYNFNRTSGTAGIIPGLLKYKNMPVMRWHECTRFDAITGCESHRAAICAPGVLGLAHDVEMLDQFDGMGMRMVQKIDPPDNGLLYMYTTLRWGAGIGDPNFMVHASNVSLPT